MKIVWYCVCKMKKHWEKGFFLAILFSCQSLKLCIEGFILVEEITDRDAPIQNIASL